MFYVAFLKALHELYKTTMYFLFCQQEETFSFFKTDSFLKYRYDFNLSSDQCVPNFLPLTLTANLVPSQVT